MSAQLIVVHQHNFSKVQPPPLGRNCIDYSVLKQIDRRIQPRGFAIKYVLEGTEYYTIHGKNYAVNKGGCLLLPPECQGVVGVNSAVPVEGICLSIAPEILADVMATQAQPYEPLVWSGAADISNTVLSDAQFLPTSCSKLGRFLQALSPQLQGDTPLRQHFSTAFFYEIAALYVEDYQQVHQQIACIDAAKPATRKELHQRLLQGRSFMEACFMQPLDIADIARNATMSEFQFFRLFKAVYGISPYQFILHKRLEWSHAVLQTGHYLVSDIALQAGFADIHCFSKAFKKKYGVSPKQIY